MSKSGSLRPEILTQTMLDALRGLREIARGRGQTLAQMSLAWLLAKPHITSVLLGASSVKQLSEDLGALNNTTFSTEELASIDQLSKPIQITDRV